MDTVFALPELLEPILEYCGAGEPFQNTLKLRLVCKGFKENVFKGLCASKQVPEETFPVSDTSKVACQRFVPPFILRSSIPLKVKFSGEVTSGGLRSIADHLMSITSLEILKNRKSGAVDLSIESVSTSDHLTFQLPFLRKLIISCRIRWDKDIEAFLRLVQVANKIASSTHLKVFSISLDLATTTRTSAIVLPVGVTNLFLSGTNHTGILGVFNSNKTLRNLTGLTLYLKDVFELYNDRWNKLSLVWPKLNPVLATWGPALKSLHVYDQSFNGPPNAQGYLELPEMNQLEMFSSGNDEVWPLRSPISQVMPNLKKLRCDYSQIRRFRETRSFFQHVKILKLCGVIFREGCTGQEFHDMIASVFSVCPSIESFDWSVYLEDLEMHSLLQLFATSMHRLKHLKLWLFERKNRDRIKCGTDFPPGIHRDLLGLLTGLTEACIPSDESTWPELLKHSPNSITNLHRLQSLKIVCDWRPHWKADRFLFNAAFFQMRSLNNLQLTRIDVPDCMITAWKETNRSISFPYEFMIG